MWVLDAFFRILSICWREERNRGEFIVSRHGIEAGNPGQHSSHTWNGRRSQGVTPPSSTSLRLVRRGARPQFIPLGTQISRPLVRVAGNILTTLLERKDQQDELACGERPWKRHQGTGQVVVKPSRLFQSRWASSPSCHLSAADSKQGQQKNHKAEPQLPTAAGDGTASAAWLLFPAPHLPGHWSVPTRLTLLLKCHLVHPYTVSSRDAWVSSQKATDLAGCRASGAWRGSPHSTHQVHRCLGPCRHLHFTEKMRTRVHGWVMGWRCHTLALSSRLGPLLPGTDQTSCSLCWTDPLP